MTTPEPIPFGFAGKPQVADTDRIPMAVVPAALIRDSANALKSLVEWSSIQTEELKAYYEGLIADLQDALATV